MSAVVVVGNLKPNSRTLAAANSLGRRLARLAGEGELEVYDLALFGPRLFDPLDAAVLDALATFKAATVAVVASPTYKASFSGILKLFLDRIRAGELAGVTAVPLMTGGAANHSLAVDVHLRPVLVELGARIPTASLYITEPQLPDLEPILDAWQATAEPALRGLGADFQLTAGR